ncbi:MAG: glycosyltransferase [Pyrinomonadaceae bacterium]|nr:glycosyltransferase [Pyrinomonadaceae bacterium]
MNPSVSVVIPAYNGAAFIGGALSSVFSQNRKPDEVIVVDDGSRDQTSAIVNSIASEAPIPVRFRPLSRNSGGPSHPLNVGIQSAQGDLLIILEQDDLMRPNRIDVQARALTGSPDCSLALSRFCVMGNEEGDMRPIWPTSQFSDLSSQLDAAAEYSVPESKAAFNALMKKNFAGTNSNFCFTRKSYNLIGGFDERITTCTDLDFILRAVLVAPILVINKVLLDYRWRAGSLNRTDMFKTDLELGTVRLRAALARPEWAGKHLETLEDAALSLARQALRRKDLSSAMLVASAFLTRSGIGALGPLIKRRVVSRPQAGNADG